MWNYAKNGPKSHLIFFHSNTNMYSNYIILLSKVYKLVMIEYTIWKKYLNGKTRLSFTATKYIWLP